MKPYLIDISVLLIFFTRYEQFSKVFEQVKIAKPSKLYLYQDGPRENRADDIDRIKRCREIAEDIDWKCEVHKFYQEKNIGCDPSEFIAQKWMFGIEEMGIILEDDDVPSQSFFPFCKYLLEEYKSDERIHMVCGMNNLGIFEYGKKSYLYTKYGSIWGWATWKRCVDTWDEHYTFLNDKGKMEKIKYFLNNDSYYKKVIATCIRHRNSGIAHYETINGCSQYIYGRLNLVPTKNMISNIGVGSETTHGTDNIKKLPKAVQKLLYMRTYEIGFPLIHDKTVKINESFEKAYIKLMFPNKINVLLRRAEALMRRIIFNMTKLYKKSSV